MSANLGELLLEHLHVEVKADGLHLPALLHPQQIANAADFHVPHGELIAAPELGKFLDRPQPLPCGITEAGITRIKQPSVGLNATAAHSAPQLIELREAKFLGVFDQDRVDPRNVEAALHDRGAEHHIGLTGVEGHHGALQFALRHLAMGHQQP